MDKTIRHGIYFMAYIFAAILLDYAVFGQQL